MSRTRRHSERPERARPVEDRRPRASRKGRVWVLLVVLSAAVVAPAVAAAAEVRGAGSRAPALRLAIAPFEGDTASPPLAERLAARFERGPHERLLAPGTFVAEPRLDPPADAVRAWAYNAAVDDVVLGRIRAATEFEGARLELVVRSGHSGAERWRETVELPESEAALSDTLDGLVVAVREALGVGPTDEADPDAAGGAVAAGPGARADRDGSGRGLDANLDLSGFDSDAPIEINAEEAEIVSRDRGRELVFQRNVEVRQANVVLRSDRLEASYKKGESEPERLVAQGRVFVDQGGRRARCDRAVYLRSAQQLTCRGHAELVQGCDIVRGESIQFDLADDRARVEGAASIVIRPKRDEGDGCGDGGGVL